MRNAYCRTIIDIINYVDTNCYTFDELLQIKINKANTYNKVINRLYKEDDKITWQYALDDINKEIKVMKHLKEKGITCRNKMKSYQLKVLWEFVKIKIKK